MRPKVWPAALHIVAQETKWSEPSQGYNKENGWPRQLKFTCVNCLRTSCCDCVFCRSTKGVKNYDPMLNHTLGKKPSLSSFHKWMNNSSFEHKIRLYKIYFVSIKEMLCQRGAHWQNLWDDKGCVCTTYVRYIAVWYAMLNNCSIWLRKIYLKAFAKAEITVTELRVQWHDDPLVKYLSRIVRS